MQVRPGYTSQVWVSVLFFGLHVCTVGLLRLCCCLQNPTFMQQMLNPDALAVSRECDESVVASPTIVRQGRVTIVGFPPPSTPFTVGRDGDDGEWRCSWHGVFVPDNSRGTCSSSGSDWNSSCSWRLRFCGSASHDGHGYACTYGRMASCVCCLLTSASVCITVAQVVSLQRLQRRHRRLLLPLTLVRHRSASQHNWRRCTTWDWTTM